MRKLLIPSSCSVMETLSTRHLDFDSRRQLDLDSALAPPAGHIPTVIAFRLPDGWLVHAPDPVEAERLGFPHALVGCLRWAALTGADWIRFSNDTPPLSPQSGMNTYEGLPILPAPTPAATEVVDALTLALPFVESAAADGVYKPAAVQALVARIRKIVTAADFLDRPIRR